MALFCSSTVPRYIVFILCSAAISLLISIYFIDFSKTTIYDHILHSKSHISVNKTYILLQKEALSPSLAKLTETNNTSISNNTIVKNESSINISISNYTITQHPKNITNHKNTTVVKKKRKRWKKPTDDWNSPHKLPGMLSYLVVYVLLFYDCSVFRKKYKCFTLKN